MKQRISIVLAVLAGLLVGSVWLQSRRVACADGPEEPSGNSAAAGGPQQAAPQWETRPVELPRDPWAPVLPRGADNAACYPCHANYRKETLAEVHRKANVGCVRCHGPSRAHLGDEDGLVPPDVMYWPERIDSSCTECHPKHNVPARDVLARWRQRCPEKTDPGSLVCTDCHGEHRLQERTLAWDKKTGKLLTAETAAPEAEAAGQ